MADADTAMDGSASRPSSNGSSGPANGAASAAKPAPLASTGGVVGSRLVGAWVPKVGTAGLWLCVRARMRVCVCVGGCVCGWTPHLACGHVLTPGPCPPRVCALARLRAGRVGHVQGAFARLTARVVAMPNAVVLVRLCAGGYAFTAAERHDGAALPDVRQRVLRPRATGGWGWSPWLALRPLTLSHSLLPPPSVCVSSGNCGQRTPSCSSIGTRSSTSGRRICKRCPPSDRLLTSAPTRTR